MQLDPVKYNKGMIGGFRQVIAGEGAGALLTGLGPTASGYFIQGWFKFGGIFFHFSHRNPNHILVIARGSGPSAQLSVQPLHVKLDWRLVDGEELACLLELLGGQR